MYLLMAQKANALLNKYNINEFPVPVYIIEQIITNEKYKIQVLKHLKTTAAIIGNNVLVGNVPDSKYREYLVHESCHIQYHTGNQTNKNKWQVAKEEAQAKAFAAYFLMPLGVFEKAMKECECDYCLSEEFGVDIGLVRFRKHLTQELLENGYYDILKAKFF